MCLIYPLKYYLKSIQDSRLKKKTGVNVVESQPALHHVLSKIWRFVRLKRVNVESLGL